MPMPIPTPLPYPWPPREPEPEPGDLDQEVNWMTYTHHALYEMVHNGVNLETATEVAAKWSRLGNKLDEMGKELRQALDTAADGWRGVAAEDARGKVIQLASWTEETADGSNEVSGCVSEQADLAASARQAMPEPPLMPMPRDCWEPAPGSPPGTNTPNIESVFRGTTPSSAGGGGYVEATSIVVDDSANRERARELHRQAAEVMQRYQNQSRTLYGRVPSFTSPGATPLITDKPPKRPEPPEKPPREEPDGHDDSTTTSSSGGGDALGAPAAGAVPMGGVAGSAPGSGAGAVTGEQLAGGSRAGASALPPGTPAGGAAAAASAAGRGGGAMGGAMPMGAGAGARQGGDDIEHRSPSYLEEEEDLWGTQVPLAPPVLGVEPPSREGR